MTEEIISSNTYDGHIEEDPLCIEEAVHPERVSLVNQSKIRREEQIGKARDVLWIRDLRIKRGRKKK